MSVDYDGNPISNAKNSKPKRYPLEGCKNMCTDKVGYDAFEALKAKYVGKPLTARKMLRLEMSKLYETLRMQGRLFRRDGSIV